MTEESIKWLRDELRELRQEQREQHASLSTQIAGLRGEFREQADSAERDRLDLHGRVDTLHRRMDDHDQAHGRDPEDVGANRDSWDGQRYNPWIASERMMLWRHRWRLLGLLLAFTLVAIPTLAPRLKPLLGLLR